MSYWQRATRYSRIVWAITRRSVIRTYRRPQMLMPLFLVPTMFLAVTSGGAARSVDLPGFPSVDNFFHFALAGTILQSTMLGGLMVGTALAVDVDNGFFDRMIAAPVPRSALVIGRLMSGAVIAVAQALLYVGVGIAFGASIESGLPGVLLVCFLGALTAVAVGGLSVTLALRAQAQWVQGAFPLVFVVLFLSSSFFPRELMSGPAGTIADYNPMSFIVEGIRNPIIETVSGPTLFYALASAIGLTVATAGVAIYAMRERYGAS